jgi:hypothetical protein
LIGVLLSLATIASLVASDIAARRPLGYDEAVYATAARAWVADGPATGVGEWRPAGMKPYAAPGVLLGGGPVALRVLPAVVAIAFVLLACGFATAIGNRAAGVLLALAFMTWWTFIHRAEQLLNDIPAALCCLGLSWILLNTLRRESPSGYGRILAMGVLAACAFWLRYGAVIHLTSILVAHLVTQPRLVWQRRREMAYLAAVIALLIVLPLSVYSQQRTGSPTGILTASEAAAGNRAPGSGLVFYGAHWLLDIAGPIMGGLTVVGMFGGIRALVIRDSSSPLGPLTLAALLQVVWLGVTAHGEPRYVFLAVTMLAICGAVVIGRAISRGRVGLMRVAVAAYATSCFAGAILVAWFLHASADRAVEKGAPLQVAATAIREDADGLPCRVFTGEVGPVTWYSRCESVAIPSDLTSRLLDAGRRSYLLLLDHGHRQPFETPPPEVEATPMTLDTEGARLYRLP